MTWSALAKDEVCALLLQICSNQIPDLGKSDRNDFDTLSGATIGDVDAVEFTRLGGSRALAGRQTLTRLGGSLARPGSRKAV